MEEAAKPDDSSRARSISAAASGRFLVPMTHRRVYSRLFLRVE
jgi:hypothetical protein